MPENVEGHMHQIDWKTDDFKEVISSYSVHKLGNIVT